MQSIFLMLLVLWAPVILALDTKLVRDGVEFYASTRTPEQIRAFYSARGMPEAGLQALSQACFLTVGLHNRRPATLWLEPAQWRFFDAEGKPIEAISRQTWKARWNALNVPLAAQATFGWTQLPESRDLYPQESVGGNVSIHPPPGSFSLRARFRTGTDGTGEMLELVIPKLNCSSTEIKP